MSIDIPLGERRTAMRFRMLLPAAALMTVLTGTEALAHPTVVNCGWGQRAIVHETYYGGRPATTVRCVSTRGDRYVVYRNAYRPRSHRRSWAKTGLIIGGSAATGAGIGGIVHGKKGALIGAALGGGVASLYEGAHRR